MLDDDLSRPATRSLFQHHGIYAQARKAEQVGCQCRSRTEKCGKSGRRHHAEQSNNIGYLLMKSEAALTSSLLHFLDQAVPLLRSSGDVVALKPSPSRSPLELTRLKEVFSVLREPLRDAPPIGVPLNLWTIAGLGRNELRNAAVLAWLLNPRGSHGFGVTVLEAFLRQVARKASDWPRLEDDLSRVAVVTEEWPLGSETDRVDIAIDGANFALFIEVKIDAPEGPDQLRRYVNQIRKKAAAFRKDYGHVIYLSRRGAQNTPTGVAVITWREVAQVLSGLPLTGISGSLAKQFVRHIRGFF